MVFYNSKTSYNMSRGHRRDSSACRGNLTEGLEGTSWKFAQQELKELGLSEKLVELIHMDGATLSILGPTDTALLQIASAVPNLGQTIFTEDGRLARQCRDKQVRILRVADVLSIWQQLESKG